jgi:putative FmdB family regulatory protein
VPTYQYACTECGGQLEAVQKFTDDPLTVHEDCGGRLRKVFSPVGIVFKGSGFYKTDSRSNGSSGSSSNGNGSASSSSDSSKSDSSKSDSSKSGGEKSGGDSSSSSSAGAASSSSSSSGSSGGASREKVA